MHAYVLDILAHNFDFCQPPLWKGYCNDITSRAVL